MEARRGESCVALCFGKIHAVGRKGEGDGGGRGCGCRACVGALNPRRHRNEGLGSGCLTGPLVFTGRPTSQLGLWGPRFRKQFFFPLSRGVLFGGGPERKADFSQTLATNKAHWRSEVHIALAVWIGCGEQKVAKRSPRLQA